MRRFLTPQEKKVLRYEKDRRNTYAESRSSSRKAIALRTALANRSFRHAHNIAANKSIAVLDEADPVIRKTGKNSWRKIPDAPLADYVGRRLTFRSLKGMNVWPRACALLRTARQNAAPRRKQFKGPLQYDLD